MVASSFYQAWAKEAAELTALVWSADSSDFEAAKATTVWIVTELLPSPPRSMGLNGRVVANLTNRMFLTDLLLSLAGKDMPPDVGHSAVKCAYEAIGMTKEDAVDLMLEVIKDV